MFDSPQDYILWFLIPVNSICITENRPAREMIEFLKSHGFLFRKLIPSNDQAA